MQLNLMNQLTNDHALDDFYEVPQGKQIKINSKNLGNYILAKGSIPISYTHYYIKSMNQRNDELNKNSNNSHIGISFDLAQDNTYSELILSNEE